MPDTETMTEAWMAKMKGRNAYVYLVNGIKLAGKIMDYDGQGILLESHTAGAEPQLIMRSAVSTIVPI